VTDVLMMDIAGRSMADMPVMMFRKLWQFPPQMCGLW
jgi:hypothetical protein